MLRASEGWKRGPSAGNWFLWRGGASSPARQAGDLWVRLAAVSPGLSLAAISRERGLEIVFRGEMSPPSVDLDRSAAQL